MTAPRAIGSPDRVLRGRFEREHERQYTHIPFEVPRGVRQLHLRYAYSDAIGHDPSLVGGNTVDIGLFDERGTAPGGTGFRGWSGSDKAEITIDEAWATPPYRSGRPGAGIWHVLLGPYKIGPRGCDWTVELWFDAGVARGWERSGGLARRLDPDPLPAARDGWLRGDLHCHTVYSDGDSEPSAMLDAAAAAGLEFLGVTDHNNVAHHPAYGAGGDGLPLVVPGVEITTYGGHWNAHGTSRWHEFRETEPAAVARAMRAAMDEGAFVTVNHPKPLGPEWRYGDLPADAIEVWNGSWLRFNAVSLAWWDERLRRGERLVAVGGSDTHSLRRADPDPRHAYALGRPTTWVRTTGDADRSRPMRSESAAGFILGALRAGHAFVSASPRGPQLYLEPDRARLGRVSVEVRGASGAAVLVFTEAGCVVAAPVAADAWDTSFEAPAGARYVRAEVVGTTGLMLALSNPIWAEAL